MATNLVSYIMQFLTPDMIGRIAAALGLSRNDAQAGVGAAVPGTARSHQWCCRQTRRGAEPPSTPSSKQSGVLDSFSGLIGGGKPVSLIEKGSSLLTSLLGGHDQSALAGAIGRFAGLGQDGSRSLLGMLTPVVLGLIGKQIGSRLDVGSLTGLLSSQKEQIAQALPAGLGKLLGGTGLLDSLAGAAGSAVDTASQAGRTATAATGQMAGLASSAARSVGAAGQRVSGAATSGVPNWVLWALPIAVIAGVLWYMLGQRTDQVVQLIPAGPDRCGFRRRRREAGW